MIYAKLLKKQYMGEPSFSTIESADHKLKNEINLKLALLLRKGIPLGDIVDMLDAKEFLTYIQVKKGQAPVAHFSVDKFVKQRTIESRKISLPDDYTKLDEVILPPSEMEITTGSGNGFKEAGIIPRSALLMETLAELGLKYSVVEGENDPKMMRKLSYLIFILPSIEKLVLVNNEEGNATFIIHKAKQEEWKEYMNKTKEELSAMPYDLVSVVKYPDKNKAGHGEKWRSEIKNLVVDGVRPIEAKPEKVNDDKEIEFVPDGWQLTKLLAEECKTDFYTLKKHANTYRLEYPDWFKTFKSSTGKSFEYYSPELCKIIKEKFSDLPPEGWMTSTALYKYSGIATKTIQNFCKRYRQEKPEWFRNFRGRRVLSGEYLHPDLVEIIRKHFAKPDFDNTQWVTARALSKSGQINMSDSTVRSIVEKYRSENPEWFKIFRNSRGNEREHYSPELVAKLVSEYGIPEGWVTAADISKALGVSYHSIYKQMLKYRDSSPEWFKIYENSRGNKYEYFSPELVMVLTEEYNKSRAIPSGWLSIRSIAREIGVSNGGLRQYCEKFKSEHPEWLNKYLNQLGARETYIHPSLINKVYENFANHKPLVLFEKAPDGWMTNSTISASIGSYAKAIKKIASIYRATHVNWFKIYKDRKGHPREHYSPELVKIIKEKMQKS